MFNNVVTKKKSKTTNWKAPPLRSKRQTSNQKAKPAKSFAKKIETNQSDPDPDPKQKKNKKSKSSPIRIMVGRQIIIIITTLSLCMCVFVSATPSSTRAAVTSTPSSGLVCSFFGQQQLHQHPQSLLQRSCCLHATKTMLDDTASCANFCGSPRCGFTAVGHRKVCFSTPSMSYWLRV